MKQLIGKVAVVTGASKGIGAGIARKFAEEGARVVINYASDQEGADRIAGEVVNSGGQAAVVRADISNEEGARALVQEAVGRFGGIDIWVNNAGIFSPASIQDVTAEYLKRLMGVNLFGVIFGIRVALPYLRKGSSVINISSLAAQRFTPGSTFYSATKAALNALTGSLAIELAPRGIRVNGIMPGFTDTEGARALGVIGSAWEKQLLADTPLGRAGRPEDIANVAAFLASESAAWLTGEVIRASGGMR
jgi:3-oxoacyl-[acyl-carrier protein] reductase